MAPNRMAWLVPALLLVSLLQACGGGASPLPPPSSEPDTRVQAPNGRRQALAAPVSIGADELFDWAQSQHPTLFPAGASTMTLVHEGAWYWVRSYPTTGNHLGVQINERSVWGLGNFTGQQLQPFGSLDSFACQVRPQACVVPVEGPTVRQVQMLRATHRGLHVYEIAGKLLPTEPPLDLGLSGCSDPSVLTASSDLQVFSCRPTQAQIDATLRIAPAGLALGQFDLSLNESFGLAALLHHEAGAWVAKSTTGDSFKSATPMASNWSAYLNLQRADFEDLRIAFDHPGQCHFWLHLLTDESRRYPQGNPANMGFMYVGTSEVRFGTGMQTSSPAGTPERGRYELRLTAGGTGTVAWQLLGPGNLNASGVAQSDGQMSSLRMLTSLYEGVWANVRMGGQAGCSPTNLQIRNGSLQLF